VHLISWNVASWSTTLPQVKTRYGSVAKFFTLHQADIICLQEVKISRETLSRSPKGEYDDGTCEFESYWACSHEKKGYSGCTTFARKGTIVRATANIFQDAELDGEGRCMVTAHTEGFVVFNVYVPFSGEDGSRHAFKMKFLHALQSAMNRVRTEWALPCILAGDLNLIHRPCDLHWSYRCYLPELDLQGYPSDFAAYMARYQGDLEKAAKAPHRFGIDVLLLKDFAEKKGRMPTCKEEAAAWLEGILQSKMIDTFRLCRGEECPERYTCWDQYRNQRYENVGTRIDYILVDKELQGIVQAGPELVGGPTAEGALMACTAWRKWQPAPKDKDGSGLPDASLEVYNMQFVSPHTGMIYMPPRYSDHIAVSVLLSPCPCPVLITRSSTLDAETVACSVTGGLKRQKSLMSFFAKKKRDREDVSCEVIE